MSRHPPSRWGLPSFVAMVVITLGSGCGDDEGGADAGAECVQSGYTETGCMCDGDRVGSRTCTEDRVWTPCSCPAPRPKPGECQIEGQPVQCDRCPGETGGRETECSADLTFDCTCGGEPADGGPPDTDDAG